MACFRFVKIRSHYLINASNRFFPQSYTCPQISLHWLFKRILVLQLLSNKYKWYWYSSKVTFYCSKQNLYNIFNFIMSLSAFRSSISMTNPSSKCICEMIFKILKYNTTLLWSLQKSNNDAALQLLSSLQQIFF